MRTYLAVAFALVAVVACSDDGKRRRHRSDAGEGGEGGEGASGGAAGTSPGAGKGGTNPASGGSGANPSAGSGASGSGNTPGTGAVGGSESGGAGQGNASGSGAAPSSAGEAGDGAGGEAPGAGGADGGTGALAGTGGDGGSGGAPPSGKPIVQILFDASSSMYEADGWSQVAEAFSTNEGLAAFADELDIGLTAFQGAMTAASSEDDPACATLTKVEASMSSADGIIDALVDIANSWSISVKWETPTGFAMRDVTATLNGIAENRPKYVLLVTDGEPNTCLRLDPQCGQDSLVKAVQDARGAGIKTLVLGVGDIAAGATVCSSVDSRCGLDHLQDVANAGAGQPVVTPPEAYPYTGCHPNYMLAATYAEAGGTARIYSAANTGGTTAELAAALQAIVDGAVP
jgi:hypothetical protein